MTKSPIVKRSVVLRGHKTSVSLEDAFWNEIRRLAEKAQITISEFVEAVDDARTTSNLSSALRLRVLDHYTAGRR